MGDPNDWPDAIFGGETMGTPYPFNTTNRIIEYRNRALERASERGPMRMPIVDGKGNVVGVFDDGPGVELIFEKLDEFNLDVAICNHNEPDLHNRFYREWQLFRRAAGDYVLVSWPGMVCTGRVISVREAATLCHRAGYGPPDIVLADLAAESQAEAQRSAEPPATEAAIAVAAARNEAMPPEDRIELDSLFGRTLAANEQKDLNALATRWIDDHKDELAKDPWFLTDRKVANDIGCSASTASTLPIIKAFKQKRGPRPKRRPGKSPRVVSFTDKVEATEGRSDDELQRLINEGEYEPSPLDEDRPGEPLRVRLGPRKL